MIDRIARFSIASAVALLASALIFAAPARAVTISISCSALGQELKLCREGAEAWGKETGNEIKIVSTPNSATERLALYQQLLAAHAPDIDVFQIDVVWPGILGSHFIDLSPYTKGAEKDHFRSIVRNNTVDGKLVAMPWYTDVGILYFRKDLLDKYGLKPPQTWQELTDAARKVQDGERKAGNSRMWGFVFQGRAYEGLTCNALEWIDSFRGGTIVDAEGKVTVDNPKAVEAVSLAASWMGDITAEGVLNYDEESSRAVFQAGNAVFMRNWPYAWSLAQSADSPVKGKVGVSPLPKGGEDGKHTGTLGGWQLAVSRYSQHPEEAADLVMYLTGYEEQKRRAIVGSYNPTIPALYQDEDVLKANPFLRDLYGTLRDAVARPSRITGARYNQVSSEFWNAAHETLSGSTDAERALAGLERSLERLSRRGW